jgi:hypothetical protein
MFRATDVVETPQAPAAKAHCLNTGFFCQRYLSVFIEREGWTVPDMRRRQIPILAILILVIAVGLLSRTITSHGRWFLKEFGDVLWGAMFYLWIILLAPRIRVSVAATIAIGVCFAIEFLKFYHAPWFESVRDNRIAGFLLGHTFYWHDLPCYVAGTFVAVVFKRLTSKQKRKP